MKALLLAAMLSVALLPAPATAQVSLRVELGVPLPASPTLLVVQPGIQVVAGYPEEVFFVGNHYWLRRDEGWYRSVHPRAGFVVVAPSRVPPGLARLPPGHYRNYGKAQAKADRDAWKAQKKAGKSGHGH
ncbi:MAG: hypothetical protein H6Q88_12 [Anaeromyxobacteraceae bacterium]|jgi:hypothetical protein|nr:hypothetical protein [Anaeromyxobacteraceae bacterium]